MPGKKFPDLTGDGKVTKADILKGRGVSGFKKGKTVRASTEKAAAMEDAYSKKKKKTESKRPPQFEKHRDPGAVERMMEFEKSLRAEGFSNGGAVCAGGRSAVAGTKFVGVK